MPSKPASICRQCSILVPDGKPYCPEHEQNNRASRAARDREVVRRADGLKSLYDGRHWRKITRPAVLRRDPLCMIAVMCDGQAPSTNVDHIIRAEIHIAAHGGDHTFFYDLENLQGCCQADHSRKTQLENYGLWVPSAVGSPASESLPRLARG